MNEREQTHSSHYIFSKSLRPCFHFWRLLSSRFPMMLYDALAGHFHTTTPSSIVV